MSGTHRLAIVLSHPTQYYSPWFRWLRGHSDLAFKVFYLWDFGVSPTRDPQFQSSFAWDVDLLSGYDSEFVPNVALPPGTDRFAGLDNPDLPRRLSAYQPTALLLFGYKWRSHLHAILWARLHRVPLIFRGDSHFLGRGIPSWPRRLPLRLLYAQFRAFLAVGAANRDYFTALGVPQDRIFAAPHSVDHVRFDPTLPEHHAAAEKLRAHLGLEPATLVVLFAGKFLPAKQPRELLDAFLHLLPQKTALVFVGDGPDKQALLDIARSQPTANVHFLPFANQSTMPAHLLLADLFVLPSRGVYETWGLAVNEAMHMGVPCLVSDRVGCQRDLVTPGETGWVFQHDDPADLRAQLATALAALRQSGLLGPLRARVLQRIAGYSYGRASDGLQAALGANT